MANKIIKMKKIDSLNLVPFIDVILVLLVIILSTTSFISKDLINIDTPTIQDSNGGTNLNNEDKVISIDKNGDLFFENKKVTLEEFKSLISALPKDTNIVINGDKDSNFNSFISVMEALQNLEYKNLFILVDQNKK